MKRLMVGLALSGGTAKSVAHIGVLKALVENGITIDYLAGTSGGSIVAAFYAAGKSVPEIEALAEGIGWRNLAGITIPRLGFLSSEKIREFIEGAIGNVTFKDLRLPLAVVASDITAGEKVVFTEGRVAVACQASSSIPDLYTPVEINGHILVDGGFSEYVPVDALVSFGDMFAIGVNLGFEPGSKRKPRNLVEVILRVSNFIAQQNAAVSELRADFMIRPDLSEFGPLELRKASDIIHRGYAETLKIIPELKAAIGAFKPSAATPGDKSL
ncbi:MAG TPA: patatin-like phospholipase family protein [Candidatus Bathyarchaeia archaeon]|nr:patatin-like phospholipase family protein [Candidatus Bathyarchaeia archaeon]